MLEDGALRFLSNWDRISALLGLLVDFLDCLEDVPPEDRDHLSFEITMNLLTRAREYQCHERESVIESN